MKLHQGLTSVIKLLICFSMLIISNRAVAVVIDEQGYPLVEIETRQDVLASYKERRSTHGFQLNLRYEPVEFVNFQSFLDNYTFQEIFGETTLNLMGLTAEYKYNFGLGAISIGGVLSMGKVDGPMDRSLQLMNYGGRIKFTMDNILEEPYVAPYVGIDAMYMNYIETNITDKSEGVTQLTMAMTAGLLIQLNWIDKITARSATYDYGLENTYLDIFVSKYGESQAADDPNFANDYSFGAGLLFEF